MCDYFSKWPDISDKAKAVKIFCKSRFDGTKREYDNGIGSDSDIRLLKALMTVYDAEANKGIEDKEIYSILYDLRFSKNGKAAREDMQLIYTKYHMTSPKLGELCKTSFLVNRLMLKKNTKEK